MGGQTNNHDRGTGHFIHQRISALINIPFLAFLAWTLVSLTGASHGQVHDALAQPFTAIMLATCLVSVTYHMMIGMQVVLEDYVHGPGMFRTLMWANRLFCLLVLATGIYALLKIALGW